MSSGVGVSVRGYMSGGGGGVGYCPVTMCMGSNPSEMSNDHTVRVLLYRTEIWLFGCYGGGGGVVVLMEFYNKVLITLISFLALYT